MEAKQLWFGRKVPSLLLVSLHIVPPEDLDSCIFMRIAAVWELGDLCEESTFRAAKLCVGKTLTLACCSDSCG